jgi:hypothetical protein
MLGKWTRDEDGVVWLMSPDRTETFASTAAKRVVECPRLITPSEAISRIRPLLASKEAEAKQCLLSIARIAIAAVIALDGEALEIQEIDGLQESINRALFV